MPSLSGTKILNHTKVALNTSSIRIMVSKRHFILSGFGSRCKDRFSLSELPQVEPESADDFGISTYPSIYNINFSLRYFPENWGVGESGQLINFDEPAQAGNITNIANKGTKVVVKNRKSSHPKSDSLLNKLRSSDGRAIVNPVSSDKPSTASSYKSDPPPQIQAKSFDSRDRASSKLDKVVPSGFTDSAPVCTLQNDPIVPLSVPLELIESTKKLWLEKASKIPVELADGLGLTKNASTGNEGRNQNVLQPSTNTNEQNRISTRVPVTGSDGRATSHSNDVLNHIEQYKCSDIEDVVQFKKYVLAVLNALSKHGRKTKKCSGHPQFVRQVSELFKDSLAKSVPESPHPLLKLSGKEAKQSNAADILGELGNAERTQSAQVRVIDVNTVESVWKRWNEQIEPGSQSLPELLTESIVADSTVFETLARSLSAVDGINDISHDEVFKHYLLWPSGTSSFHNLVEIATREFENSTTSRRKSLGAAVQILNRLTSYISQLAGRIMEIAQNEDTGKRNEVRNVAQEFEKRVISEAKENKTQYITANMKKLFKAAKTRSQQRDDPLHHKWSEISNGCLSAFRALKDIKAIYASKPATQNSIVDSPDPCVAEIGNARPVPVSSRSPPVSSMEKNKSGGSKESVSPSSPGCNETARISREGVSRSAADKPAVMSTSTQLEKTQSVSSSSSMMMTENNDQTPLTVTSKSVAKENPKLHLSAGKLNQRSSTVPKVIKDKQPLTSLLKSKTVAMPRQPRKMDSSTESDGKDTGRRRKSVQFNPQSDNPKLVAQLRGVKPAADFTTLETIFMDSGKVKPSSLLNPSNEIQKAAVVERLNEMTVGGIVKYYGMLCEFVGGFAEHARRRAQTGQTPELPPPTTVVLPDLRELEKRAQEIDRQRSQ